MRPINLVIVALAIICTPLSYSQQPALQITSPSDGSVISSGQTLTITVSADPSFTDVYVTTDGALPDLQPGTSANPGEERRCPCPSTLIGTWNRLVRS